MTQFNQICLRWSKGISFASLLPPISISLIFEFESEFYINLFGREERKRKKSWWWLTFTPTLLISGPSALFHTVVVATPSAHFFFPIYRQAHLLNPSSAYCPSTHHVYGFFKIFFPSSLSLLTLQIILIGMPEDPINCYCDIVLPIYPFWFLTTCLYKDIM